jgi:predicted AAA+ superfamily ATPase
MEDVIARIIGPILEEALKNRTSIFLLGPRQTGKTTIVSEVLHSIPHLALNLMETRERLKFERDPSLIIREAEAAGTDFVFIDEVQKIPDLLDNVQVMIDRHSTVFVLTGSSARKLRRANANLLPGRVLSYRMDPLSIQEYRNLMKWDAPGRLEDILKYGELPKPLTLVLDGRPKAAEEWLYSYVTTYLEEEIRAESLVRKMGIFSRFLKLAAGESGRLVSFRAMSQDIGIPHTTISEYYQILEDCLVAERIEPLIPAGERGKVRKASKFLLFDTGVMNASAEVLGPADLPAESWGRLFEQWVGLTILRFLRSSRTRGRLFYWRDYAGREIDWVIEQGDAWIPVEVKWGENIKPGATRHLEYFLKAYPDKARKGFVIFTGRRSRKIDDNIMALTPAELPEALLN